MESVVFACFRCWECLEVWCPCSCIKLGANVLAIYAIFLAVLLLYLYVPEFAEFPNSFLHFFSMRRENPFVGESILEDKNKKNNTANLKSLERQANITQRTNVSDTPGNARSRKNQRKIFRFPQPILKVENTKTTTSMNQTAQPEQTTPVSHLN